MHRQLNEEAAAIGHALDSATWTGLRAERAFTCPIGHRWFATPERFRRADSGCDRCTEQRQKTLRAPVADGDPTTVGAALRLVGALGPFARPPRVPRESMINAGQLRLLLLLGIEGPVEDDDRGADRHRARALDGHGKPTVDARLRCLEAKGGRLEETDKIVR